MPSASAATSAAPSASQTRLRIEAEVHHVAFAHDIIPAFQPHLARFLGPEFAIVSDEVLIGDGLGADEPLFEVSVYHPRRLRGSPALVDGPGARLLRSDGEESHETQEVVAGVDQPGQAGLVQTDIVQK